MKRLLSIMLIATMCLSIVACGKKSVTNTEPEHGTTSTEEIAEEAAEAVTEEIADSKKEEKKEKLIPYTLEWEEYYSREVDLGIHNYQELLDHGYEMVYFNRTNDGGHTTGYFDYIPEDAAKLQELLEGKKYEDLKDFVSGDAALFNVEINGESALYLNIEGVLIACELEGLGDTGIEISTKKTSMTAFGKEELKDCVIKNPKVKFVKADFEFDEHAVETMNNNRAFGAEEAKEYASDFTFGRTTYFWPFELD